MNLGNVTGRKHYQRGYPLLLRPRTHLCLNKENRILRKETKRHFVCLFIGVYFVVIKWACFLNRTREVEDSLVHLNTTVREHLPDGEVISAEAEERSVKKRDEETYIPVEKIPGFLFLLRQCWVQKYPCDSLV